MSSRGRVLLVDDDDQLREAYAGRLADAGFEVSGAASAAEAFQRLEEQSFDAVLTDVSLPEMDGVAMLHRMRERGFQQSVVLMFDRLENSLALRAAQEGALQSLVKPIGQRELVQVAQLAVESRHRLRAMRSLLTVFRNRRGEPVEPPSFTATEAKNEFGRVLETAIREGAVVIRKHDSPKAVLLSLDELDSLARSGERELETLSGEFDALLAKMQSPKARRGMEAAFGAGTADLAKAAVAAARKRG